MRIFYSAIDHLNFRNGVKEWICDEVPGGELICTLRIFSSR